MSDILECVEAVKTCSKCGETKPISEFRPQKRQCHDCLRKQQKEYRNDPKVKARIQTQKKEYRIKPEVKERLHAYYAAYRENTENKKRLKTLQATRYKQTHGRALRLLDQARHRAKDKGIPFDLTPEWLEPKIDAGVCKMTGISFDMGKPPKGKAKNPYAPSIDQIIPSAGYTPDNCRLVIWDYNKDKGDGTDRETLRRYKTVLEYNGNVVVSTRNPFGLLVKILSLHSFKPKG